MLTVPGASCTHGTLCPAQPREVGTVLLSLLQMGLLGGGAVIWTQAIFAPKFMLLLNCFLSNMVPCFVKKKTQNTVMINERHADSNGFPRAYKYQLMQGILLRVKLGGRGIMLFF